jgi:hypothetical protein
VTRRKLALKESALLKKFDVKAGGSVASICK